MFKLDFRRAPKLLKFLVINYLFNRISNREEVVVKMIRNFNNETLKTKEMCIIFVLCNTTSKLVIAE